MTIPTHSISLLEYISSLVESKGEVNVSKCVFCSSGCKDAKDTLVRKGNIELSKITTVFMDHRDAIRDLFNRGDK
jgi:hypothetical protein